MRIEDERRALLASTKPRLRVFPDEALNAEARAEDLDPPLTPIEAFFVRDNGVLPDLGPDPARGWRLAVDGEVDRPRAWSLEALRAEFPVASLVAVLECAGNGRAGFDPPTDGLPWGVGAVGCARWTGVRLADVLAAAGLRPSAVYTGHESPDHAPGEPGRPAISRGLPIEKALAPETLLAFAMNDAPLPALHGGPLRVVAPGYPGSAWQKWIARIRVRDREHDGAKMTGLDYRLPTRPVAPGEPIDEADFAVIREMPVRSLLTAPAEGFEAPAGATIEARGFAWSGGPPPAAVAVSADGGRTFVEATLEEGADRFAWRRFRAAIRLERPGPVVLCARATDAAGRAQPMDAAPWNPRGYCNNAVHRVKGTALG